MIIIPFFSIQSKQISTLKNMMGSCTTWWNSENLRKAQAVLNVNEI